MQSWHSFQVGKTAKKNLILSKPLKNKQAVPLTREYNNALAYLIFQYVRCSIHSIYSLRLQLNHSLFILPSIN